MTINEPERKNPSKIIKKEEEYFLNILRSNCFNEKTREAIPNSCPK